MTGTADWGTLRDYMTGDALRPATRDEWQMTQDAMKSGQPGAETGAWRDDDVHFAAVYVDGGPETEAGA